MLLTLLFFGRYYYRQQAGIPPPADSVAPEETLPPMETKFEEANTSPTPTPEVHRHSWMPVYGVSHSEETGHWETVIVQDAYDEPVYGTGFVCGVCGAGFGDSGSAAAHIGSAHNYEGGYYQSTVQTGSTHHDAVTEQRWVVDTLEEDKSTVTGYRCECGEMLEIMPSQRRPQNMQRKEG